MHRHVTMSLPITIATIILVSSKATMSYEVACVDISPLGEEDSSKAEFCAIGLWTEISVSILRLPSLEQVDNQLLGGGGALKGCLRVH